MFIYLSFIPPRPSIGLVATPNCQPHLYLYSCEILSYRYIHTALHPYKYRLYMTFLPLQWPKLQQFRHSTLIFYQDTGRKLIIIKTIALAGTAQFHCEALFLFHLTGGLDCEKDVPMKHWFHTCRFTDLQTWAWRKENIEEDASFNCKKLFWHEWERDTLPIAITLSFAEFVPALHRSPITPVAVASVKPL